MVFFSHVRRSTYSFFQGLFGSIILCCFVSCEPKEEEEWYGTADLQADYSNDSALPYQHDASVKRELVAEDVPSDAVTYTIPEMVTMIREGAFSHCTQLEVLVIPKSLKVIPSSTFSSCAHLKIVTSKSPHFILESGVVYDDEKKEVEYVFPSIAKDKIIIADTVVNIRDKAFRDCVHVREVVLPTGLERIGNEAFENCQQLERINLPQKLRIIGFDSFKGCSQLKDIRVESDYYHLEDGVLYRDKRYVVELAFDSLIGEELQLLESTKWIEPHAFSNCKKLRKVILPEGLSKIGWSAFQFCEHLKSIAIPRSVHKLDAMAFADCTALKNVELSYGLRRLGVAVFHGCRSLEQIVIPSSVDFLVADTFFGCSQLKKVSIPDRVKEAGPGIFALCMNLENVSLSDNLAVLKEEFFYQCYALKSIRLPRNIKEIRKDAFGDCKNLREIIIVSTELEKIDKDAFRNCESIERIVIPKGAQSLRELILSIHPEWHDKIVESNSIQRMRMKRDLAKARRHQ